MEYPKTFKPEATVSKDHARPVLTKVHLLIDEQGKGKKKVRRGYIQSTNSYCGVHIPVTVEESDTPGPIPLESIKTAVGPTYSTRKNTPTLIFELNEVDRVVTDHGRISINRESHLNTTAPNLLSLAAGLFKKDEEKETQHKYVGINAKFLAQVSKALGSDEITLRVGGTTDAIIVLPNRIHDTPDGEEAFGLIMPTRIQTSDAERRMLAIKERAGGTS